MKRTAFEMLGACFICAAVLTWAANAHPSEDIPKPQYDPNPSKDYLRGHSDTVVQIFNDCAVEGKTVFFIGHDGGVVTKNLMLCKIIAQEVQGYQMEKKKEKEPDGIKM